MKGEHSLKYQLKQQAKWQKKQTPELPLNTGEQELKDLRERNMIGDIGMRAKDAEIGKLVEAAEEFKQVAKEREWDPVGWYNAYHKLTEALKPYQKEEGK